MFCRREHRAVSEGEESWASPTPERLHWGLSVDCECVFLHAKDGRDRLIFAIAEGSRLARGPHRRWRKNCVPCGSDNCQLSGPRDSQVAPEFAKELKMENRMSLNAMIQDVHI